VSGSASCFGKMQHGAGARSPTVEHASTRVRRLPDAGDDLQREAGSDAAVSLQLALKRTDESSSR
jgi:hypothetical protein